MKKKRKLYVVIALLAVAGLVLTSLSGMFTGLLAGNDPAPQGGIEEYLRHYEREAAALEKSLEEDPDNAVKLKQLADIKFEMGYLYNMMGEPLNSMLKFTESFTAYQDALDLDPENNDLRIKTAMAGHYAGNFTAAEEKYKEAMAVDPRHPGPYFYYGVLLYTLGDLEGAAEKWEVLLDLEEGFDQEEYASVQPIIFTTAVELLEQVRIGMEALDEEGEDTEGEETEVKD